MLEVDHADVRQRVHLAVDVDHVVVVEAAHDVHDGVALADVRQELVPEASASEGAFHQAGDVHELAGGGDDVGGAADGGERLQAVVRRDDPAVRSIVQNG